MVGSYEESILRGRMSTTPSKPLDFMAQIGVLGLGKCKASLRCPAHVTLPFSAVFYSYASTSHGRTKMEDGPSPYVGQVDLENGLPDPQGEQRAKRKMQSRYPELGIEDGDMDLEDGMLGGPEADARKATRRKRRSRSPKAPPGGRYRIPEKGQLQIIIKNQNKTAVKLFLVPYDLAGMEPGTKTFIRQRSYSSGAIIDNVPDLKDSGPADRPILRYLIHLHICCPSKGRHYLYKSIRVVFANRVPDGKEKLHNEVTYPEPRFTPYKPVRVMLPPAASAQPGGPAATLAAEKAFRRRSSGFSFGYQHHNTQHQYQHPRPLPFDALAPGSMSSTPAFAFPAPVSGSGGGAGHNAPVEPIPFALQTRPRSGASNDGGARPQSPTSSSQTSGRPVSADRPWDEDDDDRQATGMYDKLNRGDVGYGGNAFAAPGDGSPGAAEGLLSKRLRSLGVQSQQQQQSAARPDGWQ